MKMDQIALACPHCRHPVIQLAASARPIQEQRLSCPSCSRTTALGKLTTDEGKSFQMYMRTFAPARPIAAHRRRRQYSTI
ncbi:hypothetical protein CPter291_3274 [Collimonas pratensis]|uniref:Uncharacterized protein n=2 Tax=Collimonas pratensis TaxID=279113 RepID=A0ABM5Z920_9BURK|nr:hypothetical protein CPter291_3274 [Collimonas pratensis]